jgi:uncharacterized protein
MSKFIIDKAKNGQYFFALKASNGETIFNGETYTTKQSCKDGIESVRKNSQIDSNYRKEIATNGQYYFTLRAGNGETLGRSEMYTTTWSRDNGIASVMTNAPNATVADLVPAY